MRNTPVTANFAVDTLSRIYKSAEERGQIPETSNPCRLVVKYKERRRERFLTDEELRRLGRVLDEAETSKGVSVHAVAAIRLLLLTGCRKGEILKLRWDEVDLETHELRLPDTKTGPRMISLSPEAVDVLASIARVAGNPFVFPGRFEGTHMRTLHSPWRVVCERAALEDLRIHDCRHSYASRALALGESLPMIGRLLGHSQVETTARYAHLAKDSVRESAVRISESIAADILKGPSLIEITSEPWMAMFQDRGANLSAPALSARKRSPGPLGLTPTRSRTVSIDCDLLTHLGTQSPHRWCSGVNNGVHVKFVADR